MEIYNVKAGDNLWGISKRYSVKAGDTIWSIAKLINIKESHLISINNLKPPLYTMGYMLSTNVTNNISF